MAARLLENSRNLEKMLKSVIEQHEVHLVRVGQVVLVETAVELLKQFTFVVERLIELDRGVKLEQVTELELLEKLFFIWRHLEVLTKQLNDKFLEPLAIAVTDQSIVEDTE